jgi:uncharacterized membrane protein
MLLLFFFFSVWGWVQESIIESLYARRLINRGFLKGPYIPIYGFGAIAMLLFCLPFKNHPLFVFLVGMGACTVLEYMTGVILEKLFNRQFWDYSMLRFTYKNRINLFSSIFWGLLALMLVYALFGTLYPFIKTVDENAVILVNTVFMFMMTYDAVMAVRKYERFERIAAKLPTERVKRIQHQISYTVRRTRSFIHSWTARHTGLVRFDEPYDYDPDDEAYLFYIEHGFDDDEQEDNP